MGNEKPKQYDNGNGPLAQMLATKYNVDYDTAIRMANDMLGQYDRSAATGKVTGVKPPIEPTTKSLVEEAAGPVGKEAGDKLTSIVANVKRFAELHDKIKAGYYPTADELNWYNKVHSRVMRNAQTHAPAGAMRNNGQAMINPDTMGYQGFGSNGKLQDQFDMYGRPIDAPVQMQVKDLQGRPIMPTVNMGVSQPTTNSWGQLAGNDITPDQVVSAWQKKQGQ